MQRSTDANSILAAKLNLKSFARPEQPQAVPSQSELGVDVSSKSLTSKFNFASYLQKADEESKQSEIERKPAVNLPATLPKTIQHPNFQIGAAKEQQNGKHRLEAVQNYQKTKKQELWCKVYDVKTPEEILRSTKYTLIKQIKRENFDKVPLMALEILKVECVGNCYQISLRDSADDVIDACFHSSTKDFVSKKVRRGKVIILAQIGLFKVNPQNRKTTVLIVMEQCIKDILNV